MSDLTLVVHEDAVAVVSLNVPQKRNALDLALVRSLADSLEQLQEDASVRAIMLTGGKHFCSGGDLSILDCGPLELRAAMQFSHRIVRTIITGPRPVIAAVEGVAFGAGFSIAMACDFVVADPDTRFCAAFGRVGLTPDYGLSWTLPQRAGLGAAREIMMFAEQITGARGQELRIVDRLCASGEVRNSALDLAQRLARMPPATLSTTKAFLARAPLSLEAMLAWEADTQSLLAQSADFREGVRAFAEKRSPAFKGA
jgi:enoyl-CoA hydratase/carnithine racemase